MSIKEKSAYLKGLLEGLSLDETKPEAKIIAKLVDVIDEMAEEIEELTEDVATLNDYIEEIDEDLGEVEEIVYDIEDDCDCDCDCDCDDCDCDCDCCCDEDYFEIVCPSCGETVCFDDSVNADDLVCPACGSELGCIVDDDDIDSTEE